MPFTPPMNPRPNFQHVLPMVVLGVMSSSSSSSVSTSSESEPEAMWGEEGGKVESNGWREPDAVADDLAGDLADDLADDLTDDCEDI
eukprot:CAMPEP_0118665258 /NCGR_PEP_ID=MMETSP0785-20121206/18519_1 /TAXON_ID=91992 /ORGANISM="Bolidomonas pacifica, Strain CCMP 1866" /LENGTH=86 /DNA_ID=CAMNT_0006559357 /DNA_START=510 /DNA_END=770 /DNA_ORIENTATION=+